MARLFDITSTTDATSVQAGSATKLAFTVTNTTTRPVRGSLRPKALDSGQASWLSVAGDNERDFTPGQAHQVEINANVPSGQGAGKFRVRLDALSVTNPDDDFTEGPVVGISITEGSRPDPEPSLMWFWILVGVVVIALIGVVSWLAMRDAPVEEDQVVSVTIPADVPGEGFDMPGSDYTHFAATSSANCRDACGGDAKCKAWTWVKPGLQGPDAQCWLKSAVPPAVKGACCTSGTRTTAPVKP